jgi:hypothetical protein
LFVVSEAICQTPWGDLIFSGNGRQDRCNDIVPQTFGGTVTFDLMFHFLAISPNDRPGNGGHSAMLIVPFEGRWSVNLDYQTIHDRLFRE